MTSVSCRLQYINTAYAGGQQCYGTNRRAMSLFLSTSPLFPVSSMQVATRSPAFMWHRLAIKNMPAAKLPVRWSKKNKKAAFWNSTPLFSTLALLLLPSHCLICIFAALRLAPPSNSLECSTCPTFKI